MSGMMKRTRRDQNDIELTEPFQCPGAWSAPSSVRAWLALTAMTIYLVTLGGAFLHVGDADSWGRAKELLQMVVPVETLLLGGVVGYYYGSRAH
jgi:hypothetical protein